MMAAVAERAKLLGTGPCYEPEERTKLSDDDYRLPAIDCQLFEITDASGIDLGFDASSDDVAFEIRSMRLRLDPTELVTRRTSVRGEVRMDGYSGPVQIVVAYADYRQVDPMYEAFRKLILMGGLGDAVTSQMSAKDRAEMEESLKQLEQMEEQLARLPTQQRQMIERQMGSQLEKMRKLASGGGIEAAFESFEIVTRTMDLLVNEGPPDLTGSWFAMLQGGIATELVGRAAAMGLEPDGEYIITLVAPLRKEGVHPSSAVQLRIKGPFGLSDNMGWGGVSLMFEDGRRGVAESNAGAAIISVESCTQNLVRGSFLFNADGILEDPTAVDWSGQQQWSVGVSGTFKAVKSPLLEC
jgi:hypothetical protein